MWRCDSVDDCGDNSDEIGCTQTNATTTGASVVPFVSSGCGQDRYQCRDKQCIWDSWLCDGQKDCDSGEDEDNCRFGPKTCSTQEFKCAHTMGCIPVINVCDGKNDCGDNSDEWGCHNEHIDDIRPIKCNGFVCKSGECVDSFKRCNRRPDCFDASDEDNCSETFFAVNDMAVDLKTVNATSFAITWKTPNSRLNFFFKPTISKANANEWKNMTETKADHYTFDNLEPGVTYNVSVYCRLSNESHFFPLLQYIQIITEAVAPNPPTDVTVKEDSDNKVLISWSPPKTPRGDIKGYRIYYSPPFPAMKYTVSASRDTSILIEKRAFESGIRYTFWVTTLTTNLESENSNKTSLVISSVANIKDLNPKNINNSSVTIEWSSDNRVKWLVEYRCDDYFPGYVQNTTTDSTSVTVTGLSPGVNYQFKILPVINGRVVTTGIEDNIVSVRTEGTVLPTISVKDKQLMQSSKGMEFRLAWSSPNYMALKRIDWTFGVFYGLSESKLKLYTKTKEPKVVLKNLVPCETYIVQVRLLEPFGIGPAIDSTVLTTPLNPIDPPKNLKYKLVSDKNKYQLSWNSSCDRLSDKIVGYKIYITDLIKNRENRFQLLPKNSTAIDMPLFVHLGALYEIKVSTDEKNARFTEPIRLKPYSLPQVLKVDGVQQYNGSLYIIWKNIDDEDWPKELRNHRLASK